MSLKKLVSLYSCQRQKSKRYSSRRPGQEVSSAHHLQQKAEPVYRKKNVCLMQRALFLTSNLSRIWYRGAFRNKRVSNNGHSCPHRGMIKGVAEVATCFCTGFFSPLVCNTKTAPIERRTCHPHSTSLSRVQITKSLPCGKKCFLLEFVGPFFVHCWMSVMGSSTPLSQLSQHLLVQSSGTTPAPPPSSLHSQPRQFCSQPARYLSSIVTVYHIQI